MTRVINIALEITEKSLSQELSLQVQDLNDIRIVSLNSPDKNLRPDIVILDDVNDPAVMFNRLRKLCGSLPQCAVFLVSSDRSPQRIVEMMKLGIAEYLMEPVEQEVLHKAVEEVRARLESSGKVAHGSVYSFISSKGGLGATVIAVNSAVALAERSREEVALCDMSLQSGDASVMLDLIPENTIMDICENIHRLDVALLRGAMVKTAAGFDFLAAPLKQEDYQSIKAQHVKQIVRLAKKVYDHIVVDCTSMFINECTVEAFNASEKVFVVTDLSVPAVRNASRLIQLMCKVGVDSNKIEVVVNRYIKGGILSLEDVEKTLKRRIFWLFPNDFSDIVTSINHGVPLVQLQPQAPFSSNIMQFVKKIQDPQSVGDYRGIRGKFGKAI
ncbi:MAG: AAA family ATPase [Desulfuromonas sp.]|nr:AAA family ATPase [Desulfuromonas sp.]